MAKLWQLLNKDVSLLSTVSITLSIIVAYCLTQPYSVSFFASLFAVLLAVVIMLIYLAVVWGRLDKSDRQAIIFSIIAWLILFYGLIHLNGLTLSALFLT
jgi:uncharacterized protein YybS (DUF2232 family)